MLFNSVTYIYSYESCMYKLAISKQHIHKKWHPQNIFDNFHGYYIVHCYNTRSFHK